MPSAFDKLRALAQRKLEAANQAANKPRPLVRHALDLMGAVNELFGPPGAGAAGTASTPTAVKVVAKPAAPLQAPVAVYFDGKDHRTKTKVEELLRSRQIVYQVLDVTDDEAERSWITTTARTTEFPIVVIAGTPVGGLGELTQLDLDGQLVRRVFGPF
jgi:glutaredoxin